MDLQCPVPTCTYGSKRRRSLWYTRRHLWSHVKLYDHVRLACKFCSRIFENFTAALAHGKNRCKTTCTRCRKEVFGRGEFHRQCLKITTDDHVFELMPFAMNMTAEISNVWPIMVEDWQNLRDIFSVVIRPVLRKNFRASKRSYSKPSVNRRGILDVAECYKTLASLPQSK